VLAPALKTFLLLEWIPQTCRSAAPLLEAYRRRERGHWLPVLQLRFRLFRVRHDLPHERHLLLDDPKGVPNLALQPVWRHGHEGLDFFPHCLGTKVQVGGAALRAQVLGRELLQVFEGPPALVILEIGGVAVLDRGVAPHAMFFTKIFALGRAVHVGYERRRGALVLINQFVPVGFQFFAMPSPWSKKLNEHTLAGRFRVPVRVCELDGADADRQQPTQREHLYGHVARASGVSRKSYRTSPTTPRA